MTVTGNATLNYTYNYPTGANNGKISSMVVSGETITYQYDSLNRLISAQSSASWGENYGYDPFGNLDSKTPTAGSPPTLSQAVNPANNQIVGQTYDANGNQTSAPAGGSLTYDSENRLLTAPGVQYSYDSHNQRVWAGTVDSNNNLTSQTAFVYGADGQLLGEYSLRGAQLTLKVTTTLLTNYFGSKRIGTTNSSGVSTALGSDQLDSVGQFYPYGEAKGGNNPADTWSFASYWRDSATGLDYASQRYFSNQSGRFMTSDPYWKGAVTTPSPYPSSPGSFDPIFNSAGTPELASDLHRLQVLYALNWQLSNDDGSLSVLQDGPRLTEPASWNRYSYVEADPVNENDPTGLFRFSPGACTFLDWGSAYLGVMAIPQTWEPIGWGLGGGSFIMWAMAKLGGC